MKTTRAKLVEFLHGCIYGIDLREDIADKLIESGLVQVEEEPNEFWIYHNKDKQVFHVYTSPTKVEGLTSVEIIHVHSVDQCRKYDKMWNELKKFKPTDWESEFQIRKRMEELEKGEK